MAITDKDMSGTVREVIAARAGLKTAIDALTDSDDLFAAGMTSAASVAVMLSVEDAFELEFPDEMLTRTVFGSVDSIVDAVRTILEDV